MARPARFFAVALLLLLPPVAEAEIKIVAGCRVRNRPPGRCGWCALEMLGRFHHLTVTYGLAESHPSRSSPRRLEDYLQDTGIPYRIQYPGSQDEGILRYAIREDLGAAVGFREPYPGAGGHVVTLVDFTEESIKYIDPNDTTGPPRRMSRRRFLACWDGFALVLEPESMWAKAGAVPRPPAAEAPATYGRLELPRRFGPGHPGGSGLGEDGIEHPAARVCFRSWSCLASRSSSTMKSSGPVRRREAPYGEEDSTGPTLVLLASRGAVER